MYGIVEGILELRKSKIYKWNYSSKYIVVYSIESSAIENKRKLMKMSFGTNSHTKYISFKYTRPETRMDYLHANNCWNVKGNYEILYNIDINKIINVKDKWRFLKDYLMDIMINNTTPMILGIE